MKNWLKIMIFLTISFVSGMSFISEASASVKFSNIKVTEIENGSAKIEWRTDIATKAMIYYGESANKLDKKTGYSLYDYDHELVITGLKKKKTYLFKIVAISELETPQETESFLQYFSTKNMKKEETVRPVITEKKIIDVVSNAIAISWTTNEKTTATIYFREESEKSYRSIGYGSLVYYHERVISGLKPGKRYYIKIMAADRFGNKSTEYLYTNTRTGKTSELTISNIEPLSYDEKLVFPRSITIEWKTDRITKSSVIYGRNLNSITSVASDPSPIRKMVHQVRLINLEPDAIYYYKITATDVFSNKSTTKIMSFATPAPRREIQGGSIVKGSDYKVYVIEGNTKRWIKTADVFLKLGYKWNWIEKVEDYLLNDYKEAPAIANAKTHPNGTLVKYANSPAVYLLENGKKRPFSSAESFLRRGYDWSRIIIISSKEAYKTGEYL
ncbi:MAG: fibronectin type III domain-containing protein [Minisyncoccia bacterium]